MKILNKLLEDIARLDCHSEIIHSNPRKGKNKGYKPKWVNGQLVEFENSRAKKPTRE